MFPKFLLNSSYKAYNFLCEPVFQSLPTQNMVTCHFKCLINTFLHSFDWKRSRVHYCSSIHKQHMHRFSFKIPHSISRSHSLVSLVNGKHTYLPVMADILPKIGKARICSMMDLRNGYHYISLDDYKQAHYFYYRKWLF